MVLEPKQALALSRSPERRTLGHQTPRSTILAVDDNAVNLQVLVGLLRGDGHRVLAARSGAAALDIARRARPDLILLDVMMPDMDGFAVCRALSAQPDTQQAAVIFLSACGDIRDKVSGLGLGAVDYITKPVQAEEVLARVANQLARRHLERDVRRSRDDLERELTSAARMQRLLLPPTLPVHERVAFAAFYQTSRYAGGDYYDVIAIGPDRFAVVVADVSGHGAPAAIVMAMFRAVLHSYPGVPDDPAAVLQHINGHFRYMHGSSTFATAVFAVVDVGRRTLRLACAGHPPPLLVRRDRTVAPLAVRSTLPLLLMPLADIPVVESSLEPSDRVVFYTDGITERQRADGGMYDDERFQAALAGAGVGTSQAIVDHVVADLEAFALGHEPEDDQTLVVMAV